jgi:predicted kinase
VPRLIVLNGPPGIGKSTLARRYVDAHRFALDVDIDSLRRLLGRWQDDPTGAGLLARRLSLAMARTHLGGGYDVVLPQYLGRAEFLDEAAEVAAEAGAEFHEFVLTANRDEVVRRFNARTAAAADPAHVEAGELMARLGGDASLFAICDRLLLITSARPNARVVSCLEGAEDEAYEQIMKWIAS